MDYPRSISCADSVFLSSPSRTREIDLWTCCGRRTVTVSINADELSGEAWRLARCLLTTSHRVRDNGVRVQSLKTNEELAVAEGWTPDQIAKAKSFAGDRALWADVKPTIDWQFNGFHVWPDHRNGPHPDPEPEAIHLRALVYLQREATRITQSGGTVITSGDRSVRLLAEGFGEDIVIAPDEQAEAETQRIIDALFGSHE